MYINQIDRQISNRTAGKAKRLKREGEKDFSEEIGSLLDIVSIEQSDPDQEKREQEPRKQPRTKADAGTDVKVDIVC